MGVVWDVRLLQLWSWGRGSDKWRVKEFGIEDNRYAFEER